MKIYDKKMKLCRMFKGMNIRGCVEIHQRYLYSIDDGLK